MLMLLTAHSVGSGEGLNRDRTEFKLAESVSVKSEDFTNTNFAVPVLLDNKLHAENLNMCFSPQWCFQLQ